MSFPGVPEARVDDVLTAAIESPVTFLIPEHHDLLTRSPAAFCTMRPQPESAELVAFERSNDTSEVVLTLAAAPRETRRITRLAIIPNLVQLQRQLDALTILASAADDGPLAPLRALVGAGLTRGAPSEAARATPPAMPGLDQHQLDAVGAALSTPHFGVVQGPPGSGKTKVIAEIVRRTVERGGRVLVVSPTHVAVDNVVERLTSSSAPDDLAPHTIPLRFATRDKKLSRPASDYWSGKEKENRLATIERRVEHRLRAAVPFAAALFSSRRESECTPPLSGAIASGARVICGTPIGVLSFDAVKDAPPASFDLLIVDEVSKMLLSEFLAIAIKARRWVVVGDPMQLPPFLDVEECAATLSELLPPAHELVSSVAAFLDRGPGQRRERRLRVVTNDPDRLVAALRLQLARTSPRDPPSVSRLGGARADVEVVSAAEVPALSEGDAGHAEESHWLVQSDLSVACPSQLGPRERGGALLFDACARVYHTQPWSAQVGQRVRSLGCKSGIEKLLPSLEAVNALGAERSQAGHQAWVDAVATRYAVNALSVYDWLTGPPRGLEGPLLGRLGEVVRLPLQPAVHPYVAVLRKQYRMHASLSSVPRALFYGGEALLDHEVHTGTRVELVQVDGGLDGEHNLAEVERIRTMVAALPTHEGSARSVLVITPYRQQEGSLVRALSGAHQAVEVATFDRCQGREADYVILSLVRSRASHFFESPKRWNVALTRAKHGLFVVGDLRAYRAEAARARREVAPGGDWRTQLGETRPLMSVVARLVEAYDRQLATNGGGHV